MINDVDSHHKTDIRLVGHVLRKKSLENLALVGKVEGQRARIVKTRRLSLFGHIARMNESTDASGILFEPPSEVWTKPRGRPRNSLVRTVTNDLANSYTGLPEAREDAQDRVYWRMFTKHSATHS